MRLIYKGGQWRERERVRCNDADVAGAWDPILSPSDTHFDFAFLFSCFSFLLFAFSGFGFEKENGGCFFLS